MSEIKRWDLELDWDDTRMIEKNAGLFVLFTDHEAAIIKAKIEVLEELSNDLESLEQYGESAIEKVHARIAQLQAQLGGKV